MKIENDVINVLADSKVDGNKLFLPDRQLDRKLYLDVNKVLTALGGKWNRSVKAHIFAKNIEEAIEQVIQEGEYVDKKKEYQFFETPDEVAKKLIQLAEIKDGEKVLEPSAGKGAIAGKITGCDCVELMPENKEFLDENGFNVVGNDFLEFNGTYDVIIANPPFTKQQDIDHVNHMLQIAQRKVVSIMSASVLFRDNKKAVDFRERINGLGGKFIELPDGAFLSSGTGVRTCIVDVDL